MSGAPGIGATRGALAPAANAPVARSWRRGVASVTGRLAGFNRAPKHPRVDARNLGFGHALVSGAAGASRRLGVVARAKKEDKLRDELNATRRDLEQARKEAREAEELFAAAADERAAKVKELVQEIDHWHDAATLAQSMEQEARQELEEARRQLAESGGRAHDAERSREDAQRHADEQNRRVEEAERARDEANGRAEKSREDVRLQDVELDRLRGELEGLRGELDGARHELERWANEVDQQSASAGADALMEIERLKNKHEEDKQRWKRAAASAEEALMKDKDKSMNEMQRVLKETETRAREAEEGRKRAEESTRLFSEQHGHRVKELEEKCAELLDRAEKKEWYLGEARADLERAREELAKHDDVSAAAAAELKAAKDEAAAAEKTVAARDSELVNAREELAEARSMLEAVADGVESATMEAAKRMQKADERVREVHATKAEADAELERLRGELEQALERAAEAEETAERRVADAKGRVDEAWAAAEEKGRALESSRRELEEYRKSASASADEATLRLHQAEHRADSLKAAIEQKERDASRLREELAAARDAAFEGTTSSNEATERALRAEERAAVSADEARAAAISAQEKLERARRLEEQARQPEAAAREASERLEEAESKVEKTELAVAERALEVEEAREALSRFRGETAEAARSAATATEEANEKVLAADAAVRRAESDLGRIRRDLDAIAGEISRANERGDGEMARALEGHQQNGFEARDAKKKECDRLRDEANDFRRAARDAARDAYRRTDDGQRRVRDAKERADTLARDLAEGKSALEQYRDECARLAAARDESARASLKAESACLAAARDAADAAAHAVEKMRVSERAATKAYDVASSRERVLRDEMEKAASARHGGGSDDGAENELRRRVQDAKNTADWAAGLEEQRKHAERTVEEARARLTAAEDHARDLMRQNGDEYGEFGRISEALERTKRAAAEAHEVEEARRVAAVASVDASHKLRVATERLDEMTGKMQKRARDLADAERDIDAATREARDATEEARNAEARERELAQEQASLAAASFGGGVGGGSLNDARAAYESARDELSAMRGQLEEAKHTVMRAEELEQLRRTAAEAFERRSRERAANAPPRDSGFDGVKNRDDAPARAPAATSDPRGVPTQEQLDTRERELAEMRRRLDELGNGVRAKMSEYEAAYNRLQGASSRDEHERLNGEAKTVFDAMERAKAEAEAQKASVARLEAHVAEMKSVMAAAGSASASSGFASSGSRARERGGDEGYDPENESRGGASRGGVKDPHAAFGSSHSNGHSNGDSDEADRRASQLALEEAEYVSREARRRASDIRAAFDEKQRALEAMKREIEHGHHRDAFGSDGSHGSQSGTSSSVRDLEERRRRALVTAAEAKLTAKQAEERAAGIRAALDERRRELEWMRGEIDAHRRSLEPLRRDAEAAAEREREADAKAAQLALRGGGNDEMSHPVDGHRLREAREAAEQAKRDYEWVSGELRAKADEAARACRERDSQIESLELRLAGVETGPLEARYNADDTATASFRIRQIEDRARRKAEEDARGASSGVPKQEDLEHARSRAMASAGAAEAAREKVGRAEHMAAEASSLADAAAARCSVAEDTAEAMRAAAREAAARRERLLQEELAAFTSASSSMEQKIETLEQTVIDLETRGRELASVSRVAAAEARAAETERNDAAASAAAESAATAKRLEAALRRAERELAAMEQAMVEELTTSEVRLMETSEEAGSRAEAMEKMRRELMVEREKANLAMNEAKIQEARAMSARAEAETALAWQEGAPIGAASLLADEEIYELRRKIEELELTLAEVMTHGPESTVGDRATGKLMQHIQALQEKVREGREIRAMSETMLAEQALLREQAEEAKFYMAEAEAKAKEYEEMSSKLWLALDRAGIDVEETVQRPTPRQRPVFVSGLSISQGGGALDPEVEAIQRKLMEADDDLSELMNEIMTDMVKVETEVARKELDAARAEAEELRRRLADRGYNPAQ